MATETLFYIILSGILALLLALFQYLHKSARNQLSIVFSFLRFLTYFSVLLLIINPKLDKTSYYNEKPNLVVAIDNSSSIQHLNQDENAKRFIQSLKNNREISEKFNADYYIFGKDLLNMDSLNFDENRTNISKVFSNLQQVYKGTVSPILLISDGNQTYGSDYEFESSKYKQPVYSIILGDTITYIDLKIDQLNVNRYAYLKNRFPVEIIVQYNGSKTINTNFVVTAGNKRVFNKPITLTKDNTSRVINFTLPANKVGVQSYKAQIVPLDTERNTINNSKDFAIEVIDQKTNIALISDIVHPDLGAIKKSIESNEQRSVKILKPNQALNELNDFQMVILYQPNNSFKSIYEELEKIKLNCFVITGIHTNWRFLNSIQKNYSNKISNLKESFQATLNSNYSTFIMEDLDFDSFPPLESSFESPLFRTNLDVILYKTKNGIQTDNPLLLSFEKENRREVLLLGENIWKWRAQSFLQENNFNRFDNFIGKLIQYLASNQSKNRLNISFESFYQGNDDIIIKAQYFNKNFEFDPRANITILVKNNQTGESRSLPFVLKNNDYQVDLSSLVASDYSFTVSVDKEPFKKSGSFKILEFNVEQQFLNANVSKLEQVASNTNGKSYFIANAADIFNELLTNDRYKIIQKSNKNTVPLIDFKWLLILIAVSLATEWFLRKYNGLI